jgi:hypothetical protein
MYGFLLKEIPSGLKRIKEESDNYSNKPVGNKHQTLTYKKKGSLQKYNNFKWYKANIA